MTATGGAAGGFSTGGAGGGGAASGGAGGSADSGAGGGDGSTPSCREFVMPTDCTIPDGAVLPGELRCTGLYGDWQTRDFACGVVEFKPAYELWSDAAVKRRWVSLPPGTMVDASDPDGFVYPVGTQFWKEFQLVAEGGLILGETRLLRKTDLGWLTTSYVWSADGQSTTQTNDGVQDLHGTGHTVPTRDQCKDCHGGRKDFVLGWDFIQLGPGASGLTRSDLDTLGLFEGGAPQGLLDAELPGDAVEKAALGYLHANCGISCHNETLEARGRPSGLLLRVDADQLADVLQTDAVLTGVNRTPNPNAVLDGLPSPAGGYYDFRPLDPDRSLSLVRMAVRGSASQMPRIGTNKVDDAGVGAVRAWIEQMTEARGYPAPEP
jgi:hypothetical protein